MKSLRSEAQRVWEDSCCHDEMEWLNTKTFISADCFQPPTTVPPRQWDRISVPSAIMRHGDNKIHKRVVSNPHRDTKYNAVIAELDSQGFGGRKRAKTERYLEAWSWGAPRSEHSDRDEPTGTPDLDRARLEVKTAYKEIMEDNQNILATLAPPKRSTFPPSQLTWVPRKRHNTRWPVTPPSPDADLLAEFQPLIKFELQPEQIDESAFWDEQDPTHLPGPDEPSQLDPQRQKPSGRRLSIAKRPSLSTIAEDLKEPSDLFLTPGKARHSSYNSPLKRWSVAADNYRTPTKVASSPLKNFTLTATPSKITLDNVDEIEESNDDEAFQVSPTRSATHSNGKAATLETGNDRGHVYCPSTPPSTHSAATVASNKEPDAARTPEYQGLARLLSTPASSRMASTAAPIAVFDQPTAVASTEPEYETRRRVSLDNARRSERRSDSKLLKRVRSWVANAFATNRRHSISSTAQEKPRENRRHTLDVDVGQNPDIFGQAFQDKTEKASTTKQETTTGEPTRIDEDNTLQETTQVEAEEEEEEVPEEIPQLEDATTTVREEPVQPEAAPSSASRKHTHIDWDMVKPIDEEHNTCPTTSTSPSSGSDVLADAATTVQPTAELMTGTESPTETRVSRSPPIAEVPTVDEIVTDVPTVDAHDDSELALLRNFVRRAQMKPKRRSSVNAFTGSPIAKAEVADTTTRSPRVPLSEKDSNKSPSPSKKRKEKDDGEALNATNKSSRLVKPDLEDTLPQPQRKRRRRGAEMDCPDDILNPDMDFSQKLTQKGAAGGGLRRSKRVATTKPAEPAGPSQIPVRLPGSSSMMSDADMPAVSTVGLMQRKTEKDLNTLTRTNTRRNKGSAIPVHARLANLVSVVDATTCDPFSSPEKPIIMPGGKAVRWDDILVRTQGEDVEVVAPAEDEDNDEDQDDVEEELQPPQMRTELGRPSNPVDEQLSLLTEEKSAVAPVPRPDVEPEEKKKKQKALRPRASRLPAAKTTAKSAGPAAATPKRKAATVTTSALPPPSRITKTAAARTSIGATPTTKRTGVLGASLGTPAPKRRGGGRK